LTHHQINARDYPMRPTEARYLSAIGGILLLATITACSPKPSNNVSQSPMNAAPTATPQPSIAPQTTTPSPKTAAPTPDVLIALDEPVVKIETSNAPWVRLESNVVLKC
jgi:hypothetical protein